MLVKAKEGTRCPKEGKPREYITDDMAEDVPETAYYLRLVAERGGDGSLVMQEPGTRVQEPDLEVNLQSAKSEPAPESFNRGKSADKKKGDNK